MNSSKQLANWGWLCGLLLAGLVLAGCASGGASKNATNNSGKNPLAVLDILHEGDAVTVSFSDLTTPVPPIDDRIKDDGTITLLQNQSFHAAGKSRSQLEQEIHDRYVPSFFKVLTVTVKLQESTRFYYVGGEVKVPNRQVYVSRITVLKAIQSAGDFTDFAARGHVQLTRADGHRFIINCNRALKNPALDLEVYPGDIITVPRRWL